MQERVARLSLSQNDVIYIDQHARSSFRLEEPEMTSPPNIRHEQMDAEVDLLDLSESGHSVSEEDAWEVGEDDAEPMRPLLLTYTVDSARSAQESEKDGEINELPLQSPCKVLRARNSGNNVCDENYEQPRSLAQFIDSS